MPHPPLFYSLLRFFLTGGPIRLGAWTGIHRKGWVWLLGLLSAATALAQTVTVRGPNWVDLQSPPDLLPKVTGALVVPIPETFKGAKAPGYVIVDAVIDHKGKLLVWETRATQKDLERVVAQASARLKFEPAKRAGKAVNSRVQWEVIFNPNEDASRPTHRGPQLKEVATVLLTAPSSAPEAKLVPDRVIQALVTVGENGRVLKIEDAPPSLVAPLRSTARRWRFEPALENGAAVPQTLHLPFILVTMPSEPPQGKKRTVPSPLRQAVPVYPPLMKASGLQGAVLVGFEVDIEGRVSKCHSIRTMNPSFDDAAIAAVRKWRFEPGRVDGVPTVTKMQVPIMFTIHGGGESIDDPLGIKKPAKPESLPEGYRYDVPPSPVDTVLPVYPYSAIRDNLSGETEVFFVVGPAGRLVHAEVVSSTRPEFGLALKASLEQFGFTPATLAGKPARAAFRIRQRFERSDSDQLLTEQDLRILKMETDQPERILSLADLDLPLKPVIRRQIEFPLGTKVEEGSAEVEFIVDEEGRVRLPRVKSASEEAFGYAAVQSISKWVFETPLHAGRPAVVRASVPLGFKLH